MGYYEGDALLDGPKMADWLEGFYAGTRLPESMNRRANEWRKEGVAHIVTVDRYLVALSLHPIDIPEEFWFDSKRVCLRCGIDISLRVRVQSRFQDYCAECREHRHNKAWRRRERSAA